MRRLAMVSVLFMFTILTSALGQQPQPRGQPPKDFPSTHWKDQKIEVKSDPTDAAIAAALANDGDVKIARAKLQLAEAELAKARQVVTLKIFTLKAKIEQLKIETAGWEKQFMIVNEAMKKGAAAPSDVLPIRDKYETAKAALATAETELKLLTGEGVAQSGLKPTADKWANSHLIESLESTALNIEIIQALAVQRRTAVKGPIPDRLRATLDKPVKLGEKGKDVSLEQALDIFKKEAGFDVPVRATVQIIGVISQGEELPVGAWLQLISDVSGGIFYVREYGLLCTDKKSAPPDAPTLTEFWKQKPPKEEKPEQKR